jgi:hypothetical protein
VAGDTSFEADLQLAAADLDRLVRRLRSLSQAAWRSRREPVQAALAALVAMSVELEGRQMDVPKLPDHVLADGIAVIGGDVLAAIAVSKSTKLPLFSQLIERALAQTR